MGLRSRFASSIGSNGHTGMDEGNAWSFEEALSNAVADDVVFCRNDADYDVSSYQASVSGNGNQDGGFFVWFIGYNSPGGYNETDWTSDMDFGGAFYEGAFDVARNGSITSTSQVKLDALHLTIPKHAMQISNKSNIVFRNFHFLASGIDGKHCILANTNVWGFVLINCRLDDGRSCLSGSFGSLTLYDCWLSPSENAVITTVTNGLLMGNFFDIKGTTFGISSFWGLAINNVFKNGGYGLAVGENGRLSSIHNTFYNQSIQCINQNASMGQSISYNNIFMPAATADFAIVVSSGRGSFYFLDYNSRWTVAGGDMTMPYKMAGAAYEPTPQNDIVGDPLFMDVANNDFRLKPNSPALNKGISSVEGYSSIGAWQRKSLLRY